MVLRGVFETDDFILDGRTIPHARPLDGTAVEGGILQMVPDDFMRFRGRVREPAGIIREISRLFHVEHFRRFPKLFHVEQGARTDAVLPHAGAEIARIGPQTRGSPCFEADEFESEACECFGEKIDRGTPIPAAFRPRFPDPDASAERRAGRDDDRFSGNLPALFGDDARADAGRNSLFARSFRCREPDDGILENGEICLVRDDRLHPLGVFALGALRPGRLDGRSAARIENL